MILSKITLSNFRNFDTKKVVLHPSTTIITGPNSIGKTNLLEAMYVLITGAGIRDEKQDELIKIGEKTAIIEGILSKLDIEYKKRLGNYETALRKRNKILEKVYDIAKLKDELPFWDTYLIEQAAY